MRNRAKQKEMKKLYGKRAKEECFEYQNHERYSDPTAYLAMRSIVRGQRKGARA